MRSNRQMYLSHHWLLLPWQCRFQNVLTSEVWALVSVCVGEILKQDKRRDNTIVITRCVCVCVCTLYFYALHKWVKGSKTYVYILYSDTDMVVCVACAGLQNSQ